MAQVIIVEGPSGSGKSTSLRNMPVNETLIITPNKKKLPWRGGDQAFGTRKIYRVDLGGLQNVLQDDKLKKVKYIVIEDFTHYMIQEMRSMMFVSGNTFERWKKLANDVMRVLVDTCGALPVDHYVVVMHHTEPDESGKEVFKIFGKLLRDSFDLVSFVEIVWHSVVTDAQKIEDRYQFLVNDDGTRQAKSPMGMFPDMNIPNDLYAALQAVEEYNKPIAPFTPTKPQ